MIKIVGATTSNQYNQLVVFDVTNQTPQKGTKMGRNFLFLQNFSREKDGVSI